MSRAAKRMLRWLLPIIWIVVIFSFSAKQADESDQMSLSVGGVIGHIFVEDFGQLPSEEQRDFAERLNYPIRKAAHASEYAILSCLMLFALRQNKIAAGKKYGLAFFLSAAYAASDEFHQLFVPGRSCQITDVMIDCGGAMIGLLIAFFLKRRVVERCRKK